MAVYLSGASCARVSDQSLLNKLAKESNIIIQHDAWNHMFAKAKAFIYNTSKLGGAAGGSSLIIVAIVYAGQNVKVGYGVFI